MFWRQVTTLANHQMLVMDYVRACKYIFFKFSNVSYLWEEVVSWDIGQRSQQ